MNLRSHLLQPCEEKPYFRIHRTRMTQSAWLQTPNGRSTVSQWSSSTCCLSASFERTASRGLHGLPQHPERLHRPEPEFLWDLKIQSWTFTTSENGMMWIDVDWFKVKPVIKKTIHFPYPEEVSAPNWWWTWSIGLAPQAIGSSNDWLPKIWRIPQAPKRYGYLLLYYPFLVRIIIE